MITLDSLNVDTWDHDKVDLSWDFEKTEENLTDYTVDVYRSENAGDYTLSGYSIVESGINANAYSYSDTTVSGLTDNNRIWYYKLKIHDTTTSGTSVAPDRPAYIRGDRPDLAFRSMVRDKKLILARYSGKVLMLIKKRSWGVRCPDHWDSTLGRVTGESADCNCYGTGWQNGYFQPFKFKGMLEPSPKYSQITMFGEFKPSNSVLFMLGFPPLSPKDIIVDRDKRYYVQQVRSVEKLGRMIEQQARISLIMEDDIAYDIPTDPSNHSLKPYFGNNIKLEV